MWPQYWDLYEPRGPAKGPKGLSPTPPNKKNKKKKVNGRTERMSLTTSITIRIVSCIEVIKASGIK
jgi:hypothetical protein